MALYTVTGQARTSNSSITVDISGEISTDDFWEGYLSTGTSEWAYATPIHSYVLRYGGITITGNEGRLSVVMNADDQWFNLEGELGRYLDMWAAPSILPPDGLPQIPAPESWSVSPREGGGVLVGPLSDHIGYQGTHIQATLSSPTINWGVLLGRLAWAFVIVVGGIMITPEGIIPIVTNPVIRIVTGVVLVGLGVIGFISMRRQSIRS